ncbi:MAG TPA: biotin/lipoyl-binding protein, partial [Anaerolineaceae bacterium]
MKYRLVFAACALFAFLTLAAAGCTGTPLSIAPAAVTPTVPPVAAPSAVMAEAHVAPRDSAVLGFLVGGRVAAVPVKEGQQVRKGDILVQLGDREPYEAAVTAARLELLSAQQAIDRLNENGDVARAAAQLALVKAQKALDDTRKTRDNKLYQRASQETID